MKFDTGMHIGLHLVFFGKTGVTKTTREHQGTNNTEVFLAKHNLQI
jgi:hypothetical protein